jgi:GT2 family glycosyltransferase
VIYTRNRPIDLERVLTSIAWQETPCSEVLVIDDSDPDERDLTRRVSERFGDLVEVLTKDTPGLTESRNLAIERTTGDLTMFLDDDVVLRPDYVTEMVGAFRSDPDLAGAGGSVDDDHEYGWQWLRAALMVPGRKTGRVYPSGWSTQLPRARTAPVEHLIGCNMVYRTEVLRNYRFDERFRGYGLGEDLEFSHRLHLDGHRLASIGTAHLWHVTGPARADRAWGYRETVIRPMVAGRRFRRSAFVVSSTTFLLMNLIRNRQRAAGNWLGIGDVLRGRPPRELQTLRKEATT